jgi:hypothetical protein
MECDMGTRNLTIVYAAGAYRLAQYCQWDGYPSGQGLTALKFARDKMIPPEFLAKVLALKEVSGDELDKRWASVGSKDGWANMEQAEAFKKQWPQLSRDMGAKVLEAIQDAAHGFEVASDLEFAAASLFCEWAYVIDLDKGTFEAFKGFNKRPLGKRQRFAFLSSKVEDGYSPVRLAASWPLDKLPGDDEFLVALGEEAEAA